MDYLSNEDDEEKEAVGVHHTLVLLDSSTASEEGDHEDDASEDDDEDRSVGVVVTQEVQVILGLELDVDPEPHEDQANQSEDQVEQHDDGFEEAVTAVLHDVLFYFSEDEQGNLELRRTVTTLGNFQCSMLSWLFRIFPINERI